MEKEGMARESRAETHEHSVWEGNQPFESKYEAEKASALAKNAALLQNGKTVFDLPPQQLRELAALLGNSSLAELLDGGGSEPKIFTFRSPRSPEGEEEVVNRITTAQPKLAEPPALSGQSVSPMRAFSPDGIQERK